MDALAVTRESLVWARLALAGVLDNDYDSMAVKKIHRVNRILYERSLREVDTVLDDTLTGGDWWGYPKEEK